ncbi:tetratricopeptide repeat protein 33 isoform X3 [Solanum pennellii]|uniref:Tetratricopeptide repeat protein 33 isoform X3 n=1 Tax=Solanum pennellii TaxID=28526 RepID=A0ABM1V821_SOLPN|nr:tetratricopeptide repeat protein 33 isoform X3 [Solanum pennellii]
MKMTWKNQSKKNPKKRPISQFQNLPFDPTEDSTFPEEKLAKNEEISHVNGDEDTIKLVESFQQQGNKLAEEGKYREALGKWESALLLMPDRSILHEQKAQILLELGETWKALQAATRATELEPSWGEPDSAEARNDRQAALHHIQRRKQLQTSGLSINQNRFAVVDKTEST